MPAVLARSGSRMVAVMTLQQATGLYWRCSRILRGHAYGTPIRAEVQLSTIAALGVGKVSALAKWNSESRYMEPKHSKVISIA